MPEFLFQIKGKKDVPISSFYGGSSNWAFPPIWQDKVEASNSKEAKLLIEEMYGRKFPVRVLAKDLESNEFLLSIKEIKENDYYTRKLFNECECKQCKSKFRVIEKYQIGNDGGGSEFCNNTCAKEYNEAEALKRPVVEITNANSNPVIYKITNKENGMSYVGKTTQIFTLRWYTHFFQRTSSKFHKAISTLPLTVWHFEILEVIIVPKELTDMADINRFILKKETDYIKQFDSINNGYNSLISLDDEQEKIINQEEINFNEQQ